MAGSLFSLFSSKSSRRPAQLVAPERTLAEVVLPAATRRALDQALAEVRNHTLIFGHWGLGERHATGLGLAFNFAGPPGTGKTICAQAIAHALGMKLLIVDYAEAESMWVGETPKNVVAAFRAASEQNAVLFFDEADAIATRRSSGGGNMPDQRESNLTVNVLLRELENFNGIVIFATNLAANFDPAFERRIRTHVLFEMPGVEEREQIWKLQIHPARTPLAADVNFRELAERFPLSGGDIKNAVIKAAAAAASEPGRDVGKRIHQKHFVEAAESVIAGRSVMQQTLIAAPENALLAVAERWRFATFVAVGVAGVAFIVAVAALIVALL
ncbi:MAG TPA: AAA family ATPase [Thermoanaerobaculia bacterium]|nr:AAA family ATPase [Thermoanaerobaculia bacterium]